jgi:hypothetical protein
MRAGTIAGIALIVLGIISLAYQGIHYTTRENKADIGPVHITKTEHKTIPLPPIIGVVALIGGIIILAADRRTSS